MTTNERTPSLWATLPRPFFVLAPMEAVTDVVFRHVIAHAGAPDVWFTEFTNATGWVHAGQAAIGGRLIKTDDERPIVAQIWGGEPGDMEQLARHCAELGYDGIDINMGCPAKSAVKSGGAALIRQPELAVEAIAAAKLAGLPVSVKTRLGYSSVDEWRNWLTTLLRQDIAVLTIHLRTKREMSNVPAHWDIMPEIIRLRDEIAPQTLIVGNGDVRDRAHGIELTAQYGCDGVMIGRGVFSNPFAFAKVADGRWKMEDGESQKTQHAVQPTLASHIPIANSQRPLASKGELIALLNYHLDLYDTYAEQTGRPFDTLKRFFKIYIRGFDGASALRGAMMLAHSTADVRYLLANHDKSTHTFAPSTDTVYDIPMNTAIKAIIFDSDGTLLDTRKLIIEGYKAVLKRHDLEHLATDDYIRQRLGKPVPETYQQIIAGHNTGLDFAQLALEHDDVQNAMLDVIQAYPHTEKLLRHWKESGIKLCLFTSGNSMMIPRNFSAAGIPDVTTLFDAIVTADDDLARKPEPDAINELLRRIDVAPENAVVVGDFAYDMMAGSRAHVGLKIGILHGFGKQKELLDAGADFLCDNLMSLNHLMSFSSK